MNGLERVDRINRHPMVVVLCLVGVAIGVCGWLYLKHLRVATEVGSPSVVTGVAPVVVTQEATDTVAASVADAKSPEAAGGLPEVATNSTVAASSAKSWQVTASMAMEEADMLLAAGKKDQAREKYLEALAARPDEALRMTIEDKLGRLNVELIRLPWPMAEKQEYVVQTNDAIKFIARKFGTTVEMIVKGNELKRPDIIRPGQRLKVFTGKFEMVVSKARHDLLVTANGRFFKRYLVATGKYEKTPVGTFVVSERIPEPPWHREDGKIIPFGDKENILGTRWMAIKATGQTPEIKGYGIHGTWDNASIGKSESAGCIRLRNEDVEELFEMVPVGTSVVIQE